MKLRLVAIVCALLNVSCLTAGGAPSASGTPAEPSWVWVPAKAGKVSGAFFRQSFTLAVAPLGGDLEVACRGAASVYVNGQQVLRFSSGSRLHTADVSALLTRGRNVLAFEVSGAPRDGLWFRLKIRNPGGKIGLVQSSGDERVAWVARAGWSRPSFDDRQWPLAVPVSRAAAEAPTNATSRTAPRAGSVVAKPLPTPSHSGEAANLDYSRLVRVWDLNSGDMPGENTYSRKRLAGDRMVLTSSVPSPRQFGAVESAGFTLYQTDSDHQSTEETSSGTYDYRGPDVALREVKARGMDWCYFPHFAFPPKWYAQEVPFTRLRCLEHDETVEAFSPWDPRFASSVQRGYEHLAEHYGKSGAPSALYLGVHGDYGECGLMIGARTGAPGQREEWQSRFGNLHDHVGWWCGDAMARASFRDAMLRKYGDLNALNAAWGTRLATVEDITYPAAPDRVSRKYWLDFVGWYTGSVQSATEMVARTARRNFPSTLLMLPAGFGDEDPRTGVDNSLIASIAARTGVAVRSTHGGLAPVPRNQATMLGHLASACRFYGVPFFVEPPSAITADQQVGRIFEAASLGASGYFDWANNVATTRDVYYKYGRYLRVGERVVDVAMYLPTTSHLLHGGAGYPEVLANGCSMIRDVLDYDIVDERMIQDSALRKYRVLVMWEGTVSEKATLNAIREWVRAGGVVVAYDFGKIETVEGDQNWFRDVFAHAGKLRRVSTAWRFVPDGRAARVLPRYRVAAGDERAESCLCGDWYAAEASDGVSRRWTGAAADVLFPVLPGVPYVVTVNASVPEAAAGRRRDLLVNGVRIGAIPANAGGPVRFTVPATVLEGRSVADVTISCDTWRPSQIIPGNSDSRQLGVWVEAIEMAEAGYEDAGATPTAPAGRFDVSLDTRRLKSDWAKPYGQGWSVFYPGTRSSLRGYMEVVRFLTYHLSELDPARHDAVPVDNAWDGVYATLQTDRVLLYNPGKAVVSRRIRVPSGATAAGHALRNVNVKIEPVSLASVPLGTEPVEMLLQCERFVAPAGLRATTGSQFSPGSGVTHILVPTGRAITTRFRCVRRGVYTVYFRGVRRGRRASASVRVDGALLMRPMHEEVDPPSCATVRLGTIALSPGVHTLEVRPLAGEDVRADYIVLTDDRTIRGYTFSVR